MAGSIKDWPGLFRQALKHLEPNGLFEIQEFEFEFHSEKPEGLTENSAIMQWQKWIDKASVGMGKQLNCAANLNTKLEDAGFTEITFEVVKVCKV